MPDLSKITKTEKINSPTSELSPISENQEEEQPFQWYDDDHEEQEETTEDMPTGCCGCLYFCSPFNKIPVFAREWINRFLILSACLMPGLIDYVVYIIINQQNHIRSIFNYRQTYIFTFTLIAWSIACACSYLVFLFCQLFFWILPIIVTRIFQFSYGYAKLSARFEILMDYIRDLRFYLSFFVWSILAVIATNILLRPDINRTDQEAWRPIFVNCFNILLVGSLFLLIQKLSVQMIAVRFHRIAYQDRVRFSNFAIDMINRLNLESRKILKEKQQIQQILDQRRKQLFMPDHVLGIPYWRKLHIEQSPQKQNLMSFDDSAIQDGKYSDSESMLSGNSSTRKSGFKLNFKFPLRKRANSFDDLKSKKVDFEKPEYIKSTDSVLEGSKENFILEASISTPQIVVDNFQSPLQDQQNIEFQQSKQKGIFSFLYQKQKQHKQPCKQATSTSLNQEEAQLTYEKQNKSQSNHFFKLAKEIGKNLNNSPKEAKKIAKRIFDALFIETTLFIQLHSSKQKQRKRIMVDEEVQKKLKSGCLYIEDFAIIFPDPLECQKVFDIFDKDGNHSISKQEIKETVVSIYKERKALSSGLRDVGSAVGKLDIMLTIIVLLLTLLAGLVIFGVSLGSFLVTSMSLLLAATFVFGNSAKNVFEGIIFLFITHPYDVGDRVFIDNQNLIVKELGILTTVFQRWDGQIIYCPNATLSLKQIVNVRRSPNQTEVVEVHVAFDTPIDKLNLLKHKLNEYLHAESREFFPKMDLQFYEIENVNKLKIQLFLEHRSNWQDGDKRWTRRNKFYFFLKQTLTDLNISYSYPKQKVNLESNFNAAIEMNKN